MHHVGMRFSINIPNFGDFADARTVATVAVEAEEAGWDALFVWDHVVHDKRRRRGQPFGDPWMLMTAAALATSRLRLGALVTPVARRRPEPRLWVTVAGAGCILAVSGLQLIAGDAQAPQDGCDGSHIPGILLSLLVVAAGFVLMHTGAPAAAIQAGRMGQAFMQRALARRVGTCVSGGFDSSAVAATAARIILSASGILWRLSVNIAWMTTSGSRSSIIAL